jgi:hypothetical protein
MLGAATRVAGRRDASLGTRDAPRAPPAAPERHYACTWGLHLFTVELNLSNSRTRSRVKLGGTVDRRAQVELKSERV